MVKNPNWQEADQLAIYKRGREVELKKQLQLENTRIISTYLVRMLHGKKNSCK